VLPSLCNAGTALRSGASFSSQVGHPDRAGRPASWWLHRPTASSPASLDEHPSCVNSPRMEHQGGCHCGNLRVHLRLSKPPAEMRIRSCACSFCRSHGTRTVSDPGGLAALSASDWSLVEKYRFGSRTADYLLCRRCGVYVGAVCETPSGRRAVINTLCLEDRAAFAQDATRPDYDGEAADARQSRREANWMPLVTEDRPD
jgi:hypothetical protein